MVTFKPRASKSAATEAAEIPLPSDETTPPKVYVAENPVIDVEPPSNGPSTPPPLPSMG